MQYQIGDRFRVGGWKEKYILAQIGPGRCTLIGLKSGNRLSAPITVKTSCYNITEEEMKRLSFTNEFRRISKGRNHEY